MATEALANSFFQAIVIGLPEPGRVSLKAINQPGHKQKGHIDFIEEVPDL